MTPEQLEADLAALAAAEPRRGLEEMRLALARLGHPEQRLPPILHVAGTNGKGSTIAFVRAILQAAGLPVHVFTSPHLHRFTERFVVAGQEAKAEALHPLLARIGPAVAGLRLHYFHLCTLLAVLAFAEAPAAACLIETGIGGRLDATNAIEPKAVTVVTAIGHDHQEVLGPTPALIAREKAGIFRARVPAVIGPQIWPEARVALLQAAQAVGAPVVLPAGPALAEPGGVMALDGPRLLPWGRLGLKGAHQAQNAAVALAALRVMPLPRGISGPVIARGLAQARWPGRLERLPDPAPGLALFFDGAHNPEGAAALAAALPLMPERPHWLLLGRRPGRDHAAFLAPLTGKLERILTLDLPGGESGAALAQALGRPVRAVGSVRAAIAEAQASRPAPVLVAAGSLYLAPLLAGL